MTHSSLLVIITFGVIRGHSKIINILGEDYNSRTIKTYEGTAPSTVEFRHVNGVSSVIINVDDQGYYIGPIRELGTKYKMPNFTPTSRNKNFTDLFGNTLLCEQGELELKKTNKRYKIRTRPSAYIIECFLDKGKNRVFLLSGNTKRAKMGKLHVFDIKNVNVQGEYVLTEEIVDVGDNITAVTVSQHFDNTGIILLIKEMFEKNSFAVILLKEEVRTFNDSINQAAKKISVHFHKVLQSRINQLINDNSKLRLILQAQLENLKNNKFSLPEKVIDIKSSSQYAEMENAFDKMRKKMFFLYQRNILGKDTKIYVVLGNKTRIDGILPIPQRVPERDQCWKRTSEHQAFRCAPETQFQNKVKDFLVSEKAFIEIEEWLNGGADTKSILGVIQILGQDYEVNIPQNHFTTSSNFLEYQREIFGLIGAKFKTQPLVFHDPKYKNFNRKVPLSFGNEMNCDSNGRATFVDNNINPSKNYMIKTGNSSFTFQCYEDLKRNRAFLLSGNQYNASKGKLYAIDTSEVDIVKGVVVPEEIEEVGDNLSVVTVRDSDGVIMLSQEVTVSNEKVYKMILLKPISEEIASIKTKPIDLLTVASNYSSKLYSTYDAEESEFINAIVEVDNSLVSILKEKWKIRSKKLLEEQEKLQTVGSVLMTYFYKVKDDTSRFNLFQSIVSLLALNDTIVKTTFEDELSAYIKDTGKDLFKIYIKERTVTMTEFHLLDLEVVCNGNFKGSVTEADEWYFCVRSSAWREREKFHERLQSLFDEIMYFDSS